MKTYPSPEERQKIIEKRRALLDELLKTLAVAKPGQQSLKLTHLQEKYGPDEVLRLSKKIQQQLQARKNVEDDAIQLYEQYVEDYRRFGGNLPFLDFKTFDELTLEFGDLFAREMSGHSLSADEQNRLDELDTLMFKGSIFWDDITPEDPPADMPEVDFYEIDVSDIQEDSNFPATIQLAQKKVPACPRDGFPMLKINGRLECTVEYIDRYVGQQEIVDVIKQGETYYWVFANGYQLPLLCSCCNGPLIIDNVSEERQKMIGLRLEAMSMMTVQFEDGGEFEELILEFSNDKMFSKKQGEGVSFEVAVHLKHASKAVNPNRPNMQRRRKKKKTDRKKKRKGRK